MDRPMPQASRRLTADGLPPQPFFSTPEQRTALARERFFEEHQHPGGLVSEAIVQSWTRSRALGHAHHKPPSLEPVHRNVLQHALARSRGLLDAAQRDLQQFEVALAGTACRVLLTDGAGVIVHVTEGARVPQQQVLNLASRPGVNLAEAHLGTTAPGIVARTGEACTVQGREHFYDAFGALRCAAAPIRDASGRLVGVLDVSTESGDFGFDAATVVGLYAAAIENRVLVAQARCALVLRLQTMQHLLDTPLEGLVGIDAHGQVAWMNGVGRRLLGRSSGQDGGSVHALVGVDLQALLSRSRSGLPQFLQLPTGLGVWVRGEPVASDGIDFRHAVATSAPAPARVINAAAGPGASSTSGPRDATAVATVDGAAASLATQRQQLIAETLQANGGNVARTARQLGVSRGLVYRHAPARR